MTPSHIDEEFLSGYAELSLTAATASAVEAHLMTCARCRAEFAAMAANAFSDGPTFAERMWDGIVERVDGPQGSIVERILEVVGVRPETARLLAVTPALRLAWLAGVALVATFAITATGARGGDHWLLLALAPLLPLAGVATAFGQPFDPAYEIGVATPFGSLHLLLLRTLAVLATTVPILVVAALLEPGSGWTQFGWLLPSFAMVMATLALSSWIATERAAIALGVAWLAALLAVAHRSRAGDVVTNSTIFTSSGQAVVAAISIASAVIVVLRRQRFDLVRVSRGQI